jgi:hypothetical protein
VRDAVPTKVGHEREQPPAVEADKDAELDQVLLAQRGVLG